MRNTAAYMIVSVSIWLVFQGQSYSAAETLVPSGSSQIGTSNDVMGFGAKCDAASASDASMRAGSNILTSQQSSFRQTDVGKVVAVMGAGAKWTGAFDADHPAEIPYATVFSTIQKIVDPHDAQLSDTALTTVTETQASWATDDSAAIQTALNQLQPNGQLSFSKLCGVGHAGWQSLSINTSNVTLSGKGPGSGLMVFYTPIKSTKIEPFSALKSTNTTGLSIRDLEINGNGILSTLLGLFHVSNSTIAHDYFHNTGNSMANCIFTLWGNSNTYTSNTASHCGRGFWLGNPVPEQAENNATVTHNLVTDNIWSGIGGTLRNSVIDSNTILRNGGSGIPLGSTPGDVYQNVTISHNVCEYNSFEGVQSDTSPGNSGIPTSDPIRLMTGAPREIMIVDNVIDHNGLAGVYAVYGVDWMISKNKIYDNGFIGAIKTWQVALLAQVASGTPGQSGITIGWATDIKVLNNQIYDDQSPPTQYNGVNIGVGDVRGGVKRVTLDGNTITGQREEGIHLTAGHGTGEGIIIINNTVRDNGSQGIVINKGYSNVRVSNNIARGNAKADYRGDIAVQGGSNTFGTIEGLRPPR